MNWIWSAKQSTRQLRYSGAAAYLDLAGPGSGVAAGTGVTLPYLAAASALPGISGAAAFTTSSANFRWLVSSCSAKS